MNRLVIIGNGFDIAHGLKTSYKDFVNWYWEQRIQELYSTHSKVTKDCLCDLVLKENSCSWFSFLLYCSELKNKQGKRKYSGSDLVKIFQNKPELFGVKYSTFFETILQSLETKGWVDIENDYYYLLKQFIYNPKCKYTCKELNAQLSFLKDKLIEYLRSISLANERKEFLFEDMINFFDPADFSTEGRDKAFFNIGLEVTKLNELENDIKERNKLIPKRIMLLSFNYTNTAQLYNNFNLTHNYIHGDLNNLQNIIFGYGDELDKAYQDIRDRNDNELMKNVKAVRYLETKHYREMLEFIQSAPFQVLIMGHSCGNSDRTLLNTVFEHENCVSIKPYYHKWDDGTDNYLELVQNISRNFTNMKLFRDRVVNKEQCSII